MAALLTEHLPLVTSAPKGVTKLRQLIMQLAVMGKLVPQDPSDEPAKELFEQILVAKKKYALGKKPYSGPSFDVVRQEEKKFSLPSSWIWARFGELTVNRDSERVPVASDLRVERRGIYDYYGASGVIDTIDDFLFDKPLLLIGEDGANLVNRSTPIAFIAKGRYWVNNHAHVLDTTEPILMLYLALYINAISLLPFITGTAQPKMNQAKMNQIPVSLPPLAEQHRIVAKFDELMALCDRLDAQQSDAEAAHEQLVKALLATLTHSVDQADFATRWERIKWNFDTIFTTESSIDALKQALKQLAVMGKLVPQDPRDEPASELVRKVIDNKEISPNHIGANRGKLAGRAEEEPVPFKIPASWRWTQLSDLMSKITDGTHNSPPNVICGDYKYISAKNIKSWGLDLGNVTYVTKEVHREIFQRCNPEFGDILYIKDGATTGVVAINTLEEPFSMLSSVALLKPSACIFNRYAAIAMAAPFFYSAIRAGMTGVAITRVTLQKLNRFEIPLPPLAEQHRIVAKLDELLMICDRLKKMLANAREKQELVSTALAEHAIRSDNSLALSQEKTLIVRR